MASKLIDELEHARGFHVSVKSKDLDHKHWKKKLIDFLIEIAQSRPELNTIKLQAQALGVPRQTLANWLQIKKREKSGGQMAARMSAARP